MRCLIPQLILTVFLFGCLKVEKKNQDAVDEVSPNVQVYEQSEYILDESLILTEDTIINAERVYLTKSAAIYTHNFNLVINTQILESELGAVITHFGYDQVAAINQNGRNGGLIEIKSNTATGHLELVANSEKGGSGLGGWGPTEFKNDLAKIIETCTPGSGKNSGQSGTIQFETNNSQHFKLFKKVFHNSGGDIGPIAPHYRAITPFNTLQPNYKDRRQNCSEISTVGKSAYGGQICFKLQNQNNFECIN